MQRHTRNSRNTLYSTARYLLYSTARYLLYSTARSLLYSTARYLLYSTARYLLHSTARYLLHSTARYLLYSTARYLLYSTARYLLYSTARYLLYSTARYLLYSTARYLLYPLQAYGYLETPFINLATGWTVRGSNPGSGEIFRICPGRPWGPPSLLYNGYRVFPWGKERPRRDSDHSPPSSADGHERVKLYLYSPYGPYGLFRASVPVQG